jgi:hypothetical protein
MVQNIRLQWSKKRGFYKFGTRNVMITQTDENFGKAIPLFIEKYNEPISKVFRDKYSKIESLLFLLNMLDLILLLVGMIQMIKWILFYLM